MPSTTASGQNEISASFYRVTVFQLRFVSIQSTTFSSTCFSLTHGGPQKYSVGPNVSLETPALASVNGSCAPG